MVCILSGLSTLNFVTFLCEDTTENTQNLHGIGSIDLGHDASLVGDSFVNCHKLKIVYELQKVIEQIQEY